MGYGAGWDAAFAYLGDGYHDAPGTSTSLFSLASSGQAPRLGSAGGVAGEVTHAAAGRAWATSPAESPTTSGTWEGAPPGGDQDGPPVSVAATTDRQVQRQGQSPPVQAAGSAHATGTREGNQRSWRGVWSGVGHFFRDYAYYFQQNLDGYQATLDVAGTFPVIGEPADALNAGISAVRGDWTGAGLSAASMIPIYGDAVGKGGKLARYAAKYGDEAAAAAKGLGVATGQLHHVISAKVHKALQEHQVLKDAYKRRDPRLVTRAADQQAHYGYQRWHRELDDEVVQWLKRNKKATIDEFDVWLRWRYNQKDLRMRFPEGLPP